MSTIQAYNTNQAGVTNITSTELAGSKRALDVFPKNTEANPLYVTGAAGGGISAYQVDYLEDSDPLYVGKTNSSGAWLIEKLVVATGVKTYANLSNNSGQATLDDAWTNRAALTYNQFHILTGV